MSVVDLILAHPYIALFVGMLFGGEIFFLPAIYFATLGNLNIWAVLGIAIVAATISDTFWYGLGRWVQLEKLYRLPFLRKRNSAINTILNEFDRHHSLILIYSKFAYGTRTIVQVLSGHRKIPYAKYLAINVVGTSLWAGMVAIISILLQKSLPALRETLYGAQLIFLLFLVVVIGIHAWGKKRLALRTGSPLKEKNR